MSWNANKALELMFCGVLRGHFGHFCLHRCTCRHFCQKNFLSQRNSFEQWKNLVVSHYPRNLCIMYKYIYIYTFRFIYFILLYVFILVIYFIHFIDFFFFIRILINKCFSFQIYFIYNISWIRSHVYTILMFWYKPSEWLRHFPWYWYDKASHGFHELHQDPFLLPLRARGLSGLSHAYRAMI